MQVAVLFDGVDDEGKPFFATSRGRIGSDVDRAKVAGFLEGGMIIERTTGRDIDRIAQGEEKIVPLSTRTDGSWIWNESLAFYVTMYGVSPEPSFLEHIVESGYQAAEPEEGQWRAALRVLDAFRSR